MKELLRPHLLSLTPYTPILPFEALSEQLGIPADEIIKLDANENPYGTLPAVADALKNLPYVHIYPDPESRFLRRALADYHQIPVENILAGAGADELIDLLLRFFINPGDTILNCPPTFGMYAFDTAINGGQVINVPRLDDFSVDADALLEAVAVHQPKLLFLATPNNPDGGLLRSEIIDALLEQNLLLVLDEAYMEFAPPGASRMKEVAKRENLIVLRTFSKWAGLAGLRVGYGVFPAWLMPYLWTAKQPYNVSVAASEAALAALKNADQLEKIGQKIIAERKRLYAALQKIDYLEPYPSQSNFILCKVIGRDAAKLKENLAKQGILIRYFNKPGLDDHIRISVGMPEQVDVVVRALTKI
ncbi:MAG: histidinol-phosphate transaminase [Anaerolineae bacterium]|jgi:histidinol-phosphate aminotransferase|nr:histidinol-phosphate transaminase [Anaerolineae bacterium]MBT7071033.1 histidinol-phosphate transaminase [Anaerolineae bacterium]MBT7323739.1 histidinol-phosphate transaminase [Anaerolineae bacterium]